MMKEDYCYKESRQDMAKRAGPQKEMMVGQCGQRVQGERTMNDTENC